MDKKALYSLSYGVFMLSTKCGEVAGGCITNTCMQVASDPVRIAISVLNSGYTCELIKKSGVFALSVLDSSCTIETIKHFGFQSGRDADKFGRLNAPLTAEGITYLGWQACAVISARVVEVCNLGTHTLFIADVTDAKRLSALEPLTYADYQARLKPKRDKQKSERKIVGWRCKICGFVYEAAQMSDDYVCPLCGHPADDFEPIYAD